MEINLISPSYPSIPFCVHEEGRVVFVAQVKGMLVYLSLDTTTTMTIKCSFYDNNCRLIVPGRSSIPPGQVLIIKGALCCRSKEGMRVDPSTLSPLSHLYANFMIISM